MTRIFYMGVDPNKVPAITPTIRTIIEQTLQEPIIRGEEHRYTPAEFLQETLYPGDLVIIHTSRLPHPENNTTDMLLVCSQKQADVIVLLGAGWDDNYNRFATMLPFLIVISDIGQNLAYALQTWLLHRGK